MARVGEQIGQEGLVEIADTRVMFVRAEAFESDLRAITLGQSVRLSSRALDAPLLGKVARIGLKVNRQTVIGDDPATSLDARVVEILIEVDAEGSRRLSGLTGLQIRASFVPAPVS